ncbi:MAG: 5-bromo-4-chloroindolyl phosphate hydrolysis family protein, partial [Lachnospiraceae bacterium]|nr:5-bromo-4-chloroindolyl phosphate hydrolysis family protein [Lachnospiraceae bacterium]
DWYDMGAKIGDLVQSAIDSNDFKQVNQSITSTINTTLDTVQKSVESSMSQAKRGMNHAQDAANAANEKAREWRTGAGRGRNARWQSGDGGESASRWQSGDGGESASRWQSGDGGESASRWQSGNRMDRNMARRGRTAYEQAREQAGMKPDPDYMQVSKASHNYKGVLMTSIGFGLMGVFGLLFLIFTMVNSITGLFGTFHWILLAFTVICGGVGCGGTAYLGQAKRLKHYLKIMGERDTCTIEELAAGTGKTQQYVIKDLKEMIQARMFAGGAYMDGAQTCLMTSHTAYQQYLAAQKQYELRKAEETKSQQQRQEQEKAESSLSKEYQDILREGKDFIAHIHECNEAIPDEAISEKLDRLETVVTKIFDQVAKEPESAPDLHKMMSYYLPVTRKLVDAYRQLNEQPVAGQNIVKTKKEIEASLDTINGAFENMLDRFFQDTAWDISSDISVLHTMMAQDGLMKRDFAMGDSVKKTAEEKTQSGVTDGQKA